jgi:hypothetical protein
MQEIINNNSGLVDTNLIHKNILTEKQLTLLDNTIKNELIKRGYFVSYTLNEVSNNRGDNRISLTSDSFNTTPVIFKSLELNAFNSSVKKTTHAELFTSDKHDIDLTTVWVTINVTAKYFNGGSNGFNLFDLHCVFYKDNMDILKMK